MRGCLHTSTDASCVVPTSNLNFVETKGLLLFIRFVVNLTFEFFSIGYACGFIGLFPPFVLLFCLGCFFAGATHPDLVPFSKHPPFLEMMSPSPERGAPPDRHMPGQWL